MRSALGFGFLLLITTAGCWPWFPEGENDSGNDVAPYLGLGDVAIDPETETTFAVVSMDAVPNEHGYDRYSKLLAVRAGASEAEVVVELSGQVNPHVTFTTGGLVVMSQPQREEAQRLLLLDRDDFHEKARVDVDCWYGNTRRSASGRWLAFSCDGETHLVDGDSLETFIAEKDQQVRFTHRGDRLVAYAFEEEPYRARFLSWDMATLQEHGFAEAEDDDVWAGAELDVTIDDVHFQYADSFYPVISPDDRFLAVPVGMEEDGLYYEEQLLVLDLESGSSGLVQGIAGPVVFSADGSRMITYEAVYEDEGTRYEEQLVIIDPETLEREVVDFGFDGGFQMHVPAPGNAVIVAPWDVEQEAVLYDLASGAQTRTSGPRPRLDEVVDRPDPPEVWIPQRGDPARSVLRVDLASATVTEVATGFTSDHIGLLPERDQIVLTEVDGSALHFLDPTSGEELRVVHLHL